MKTTYRLADGVIARIAQALQEAMLEGVDVVDVFRQIRLQSNDTDESVLVLTDEYKAMVEDNHKRMLENIEKLRGAEIDPAGVDKPEDSN